MKKLTALALALVLMLLPCRAEGDPNVDGGGGGGTGSGSGSSFWNGGDDGVRVTVLQGGTPVSVLDYSNEQRSKTQASFKKQCKLFYKNGGHLLPVFTQYTNIIPTSLMPRVISSTGGSNIDAIKSYFTDRAVLENVALDAGIPYENLVSGAYKLMLEPLSYFKYDGVFYAMTATEAALFDVQVGGQLKYWMGTLTHQNQPLSMYLQHTEMGIQPWTGAMSGKQANIDIINQMGVGIVSFAPQEGPPPPSGLGDYTYRTDTDVITAAYVENNEEYDITPDDGKFIRFTILGRTYSVQYACPAESGQLVWVQWRTPSTPQDITIRVSDGSVITASIQEVPDVEPPDPGFHDRNPGLRLGAVPDWGSQTSAAWSQWVPIWHQPTFLTPGYWSFNRADYTASLSVDYKLTPDALVQTEIRYPGYDEMKSGYGVNADCEVRVIGSTGVADSDVTPVQHVVALFPEFNFQTYNRLLQPERAGDYRTTWRFPVNRYSYYGRPAHFTPLWYPDNTDYPVPLAVFDAWTPGGQLYASVKDYVRIDGNMYQDGYIRLTQAR